MPELEGIVVRLDASDDSRSRITDSILANRPYCY